MKLFRLAIILVIFLFTGTPGWVYDVKHTEKGAYEGRISDIDFQKTSLPWMDDKLLGDPQHHVIQKKETLLDIARQYNLGFNEIRDLYPDIDPWIPPEGLTLDIPSQYLLPEATRNGIVINLAEMRMYYFIKGNTLAGTYPVGLGEEAFQTPLGEFRIGNKRMNPVWYIPPSLQYKYAAKTIPPGEQNPLGNHWMGLEGTRYGIHGTDIPWSIGRLVTHGCIRMYPEDISKLFDMVKPGTRVTIIYEPVKIGIVSGRVYMEVHRDIYNRVENMIAYGYKRVHEKGLMDRVDDKKLQKVLTLQQGRLEDITQI